MLKPLITLEDFSGGASLNPSLGRKNGYFFANGIDHFTRAGYLSAIPDKITMLLDNASALDAPIYSGVHCSDTNTPTYFGSSGGKIYKQSDDDSVTLETTRGLSAGAITSMIDYRGNMYFAYDANGTTTVGKRASGTSADPSTNLTYFTGVSSNQTAMVISGGVLYIGYGRYVAKYDDATVTDQVLDLTPNVTIQAMAEFGTTYLAIGANPSTSSEYASIFLWDKLTSTTTWNEVIPLPEKTIYSMIYASGGLWVMAGSTNISLYFIGIGTRTPQKVREFKRETALSLPVSTLANTLAYKDGRIYFALSGVTANHAGTLPAGVYSISSDLSVADLACHYVSQTIGTYSSVLNQVTFLSYLKHANSDQSTIFWSINENTTSNHGTLYREIGLNGVTNDSNGFTGVGTLYTFWYTAPIGSRFHFDGFGFDMFPRKTGRVTIKYFTDFNLEDGNYIFDAYSETNSTGSYKTQTVECKSILFTIKIDQESANVNTPKLFLKRFFATGKLIKDPR